MYEYARCVQYSSSISVSESLWIQGHLLIPDVSSPSQVPHTNLYDYLT
jgi:hypothetical protein